MAESKFLFPTKDGYEWLTKVKSYLKKYDFIYSIIKWYFLPFKFEKRNKGCIYRLLGVHVFGKYLPTGGSEIKRLTKTKMKAYSLKSKSVSGLIEFLYKNCFFELLHLPFFVFMIWRSSWWVVKYNNYEIALELQLVNLLFNIYPIMFHRYTRVRVFQLIEKHKWYFSSSNN